MKKTSSILSLFDCIKQSHTLLFEKFNDEVCLILSVVLIYVLMKINLCKINIFKRHYYLLLLQRITSESINPNVLEQEDDHSSVSSHGEHHTDDDNNISIEETTTINTTERQSEIKFKTQENNSNLGQFDNFSIIFLIRFFIKLIQNMLKYVIQFNVHVHHIQQQN